MKRKEKSLLSRKKIINSAIAEFGINSYAEASLNAICKNSNISKGIIYHYFKDKDELYLVCVTECFDSLTNFLNSKKITFDNVEEAIEYFLIFQESFNNYFQNKIYEDYRKLVDDHELKLRKLLKIMLYGIAMGETE